MRVGLDEVGRGALAGPVVVGAVAYPISAAKICAACDLKVLRDSKKLTRLQRERVFAFLQSRVVWSLGLASNREIDSLGLSFALTRAANRALSKLDGISVVQADAGLKHSLDYPTEWLVKGDETVLEIMLASIMAKVWRDRWMTDLAERYPEYGFEQHLGYATRMHREAIRRVGPSVLHRRLFLSNLVDLS